MKFKSTFQYQFSQIKKTTMLFYVIVLLVAIAIIATTLIFESTIQIGGDLTGLGAATLAFLLFFSWDSFKPEFLMLMQNGVSRKTIIQTKILTLAIFSFILVVSDQLLEIICRIFFSLANNKLHMITLLGQIYPSLYEELNFFYTLLINFSLFIAIATVGYAIGILIYRLGKKGITIIFIGLTIATSSIVAIDGAFFNMSIAKAVIKFLDFAFGITDGKPMNCVITCFCIFAITNIISYLLISSASVKE